MKGPARLALLPDIPGHCSLLLLPDVSPAPLSVKRRLDILEFYSIKGGQIKKSMYTCIMRIKDSSSTFEQINRHPL